MHTKYKSLNVQDFTFDISSNDYNDNTNVVTLCVNGQKKDKTLSYFILGVPTDNSDTLANTEIISFDKVCNKEISKGELICKVMKVDDDDIPLIGLRIDDKLDGNKSFEYKLKLTNKLDFFALGVKLNDDVYIMEVEKDMENNKVMEIMEETKQDLPEETTYVEEKKCKPVHCKSKGAICLPACEHFCLYFILPECYSLCSLNKAKISVFKKCLFLDESCVDEKVKVCTPCGDVCSKCSVYKINLNGSVKINGSLQVKNDEACEEYAEVCSNESFCLDQVIGYFAKRKCISLDKISICPDYKSLDITVLNECNGKKAIRLDGKLIISLKKDHD